MTAPTSTVLSCPYGCRYKYPEYFHQKEVERQRKELVGYLASAQCDSNAVLERSLLFAQHAFVFVALETYSAWVGLTLLIPGCLIFVSSELVLAWVCCACASHAVCWQVQLLFRRLWQGTCAEPAQTQELFISGWPALSVRMIFLSAGGLQSCS